MKFRLFSCRAFDYTIISPFLVYNCIFSRQHACTAHLHLDQTRPRPTSKSISLQLHLWQGMFKCAVMQKLCSDERKCIVMKGCFRSDEYGVMGWKGEKS